MGISNFLYRQGQRVNYHFSRDPIHKRIAEINRYSKFVSIHKEGYLVNNLSILLPKREFDFIFYRDFFELFLSIPTNLQGRYRLMNNKLFLEFDDLKLQISSRSELYIINEIFFSKCYQFLLPGSEKVNVIDIGMNVGLASLFFAGLPCVNKVHAFEPFAPTFQQALVNFRENPKRASKIEAYNFGLGLKEDRFYAAYYSENSGRNTSLTPSVYRKTTDSELLEIRSACEELNTVFKRYPEERFILKIDAEGAEYLIFESLFKQKLSNQVKGIFLEWHFQGFKQLEDRLLANGFALTSFRLDANSGLIYAFR